MALIKHLPDEWLVHQQNIYVMGESQGECVVWAEVLFEPVLHGSHPFISLSNVLGIIADIFEQPCSHAKGTYLLGDWKTCDDSGWAQAAYTRPSRADRTEVGKGIESRGHTNGLSLAMTVCPLLVPVKDTNCLWLPVGVWSWHELTYHS